MSAYDPFVHRSRLTPAEQTALLARVEAGRTWRRLAPGTAPDEENDGTVELTPDAEAARDILVRENARLAALLVSQQRIFRRVKSQEERDDLKEEAMIGLQRAVERYTAGAGAGLGHLAAYWVKSRANRWAIFQGYDKRAKGQDRIPPRVTGSMDAPIGDDGGATLAEILGDGEGTPLDRMVAGDRVERLQQAMARVAAESAAGARQVRVLAETLGLDTGHPQKMEVVAARLGISRERARQLRHAAVARVATLLRGKPVTAEKAKAIIEEAELRAPGVPTHRKRNKAKDRARRARRKAAADTGLAPPPEGQ